MSSPTNTTKAVIHVVIVKKAAEGFVVFQKGDYPNHHAHTSSENIAYIIKNNITKNIVPITNDIRLLESHLRVATDHDYRVRVLDRIDDARTKKSKKKDNLDLLFKIKNENHYSDNLPTVAINIVENIAEQPKQIIFASEYIELSFKTIDGDIFIIQVYPEEHVKLFYEDNEYSYHYNAPQVCHLVKKLITHKFKGR